MKRWAWVLVALVAAASLVLLAVTPGSWPEPGFDPPPSVTRP